MKYFVYVKNLKNNQTSSFPNTFTSKKKAIEFANKWLLFVEHTEIKVITSEKNIVYQKGN